MAVAADVIEGASMAPRNSPRGVTVPYLAAWRRARLLTQKDLAERAGISRPTITRGEAGGSISYVHVRALADALGVSPDALRYEDPEAQQGKEKPLP